MMIQRTGRPLPFSCEQVFDVAADIERYPEFLRGWIAARIIRREAEVYYVEQTLGLGPMRVHFSSRAVVQRPQRIDVSSTDHPFRQFQLSWLVQANEAGGCRVSIITDMQLRSRLLQHAADASLAATVDDILGAFESRAFKLYGKLNSNL
jgi:coenzyme Q-binding protein COQ10